MVAPLLLMADEVGVVGALQGGTIVVKLADTEELVFEAQLVVTRQS